jgi:hypothetical protein
MSKIFHLACGQIWLKFPKDDCHFGYITKLTGKIYTYVSVAHVSSPIA